MSPFRRAGWLSFAALLSVSPAWAQLSDHTLAPNAEGEGIRKSLAAQIGAGSGSITTPDSAWFLIKRDPFRALRRGRQLFQRKFTLSQGLGPITGDGVGRIDQFGSIGAGLSDSCATCHGRPRGGAGAGGNVVTRPDSRDAPHLFGVGLIEMLADEMTAELRGIRAAAKASAQSTGTTVTRVLTAKGVNFGSIQALASGAFVTTGVVGVDADLRVRPFFAQGSQFSLRSFSVGAFNAEMGLEAFDPLLDSAASGGKVTTPSGLVLDGQLDSLAPGPAASATADPDGDGKVNELPSSISDYMEFYMLNSVRPAVYKQDTTFAAGLAKFNVLGCGSCHVQNMKVNSDRRVVDVSTVPDATQGIFNGLFATASKRVTSTVDNASLPPLQQPTRSSFIVQNLFSDLKRHDLGPGFYERNFNGTLQKLFVTEPLWGVGTTAPYGHDGRSMNLPEVILRHGGEALSSRNAFAALSSIDQDLVVTFLNRLVLFPPDDTASNLDPGNRADPAFPQRGHGSIKFEKWFNDPSDLE